MLREPHPLALFLRLASVSSREAREGRTPVRSGVCWGNVDRTWAVGVASRLPAQVAEGHTGENGGHLGVPAMGEEGPEGAPTHTVGGQ